MKNVLVKIRVQLMMMIKVEQEQQKLNGMKKMKKDIEIQEVNFMLMLVTWLKVIKLMKGTSD